MKILLIGEYSRLHNSLKEGLQALGHEVTIIGTGDNFKQFPVDYSISAKFITSNRILRFLNKAFFKVFNSDLQLLEKGIRFYFFLPKLKNFDIVQLINSNAIETYPFLSKYLLKKVFQNNHKSFLLICGEDTPIIDFLLLQKMRYSILSPLFEDENLKKSYHFSLKYTQKNYRNLFDFVKQNTKKIIVSDLDYKIPLPEYELIPNPVNTDKIKAESLIISNKIIVFLGINEGSYIKKGTSYFEKTLKIIEQKYPDQVEIIISKNLPYTEYIKLYSKSHILLDQVFGYDQGYNALEAMTKGKVVFTGAEKEFEEYYNLTEKVCINALADVDYLVNELSFLIENPEEIIAIGKRASAFIQKEHHYITIAQKYLETWN
ncbi:glycosyltransferase [Flavobacterium procerum]|uniref:Glycosyltransferase n=1 Tax=Flavobacterium procerum TaxID=1455569 RepID=A0ABV6BMQ8_9FLAO